MSLEYKLAELQSITSEQQRIINAVLNEIKPEELPAWDWKSIPEQPTLYDLLCCATTSFENLDAAVDWLTSRCPQLDEQAPISYSDRKEVIKAIHRVTYGFHCGKFSAENEMNLNF